MMALGNHVNDETSDVVRGDEVKKHHECGR